MNALACILFHVDAGKADLFRSSRGLDFDMSTDRERFVEHADLIPLGEIGVEIVLAGPSGEGRDLATGCESGPEGELQRSLVENGQYSGKTHADGAGVGDSLNAAAGEANLANAGKKKKKKKVSTAGKNKRFNIEVDKPSAR